MDKNGVTNYGSAPPKDVVARALDPRAAMVSVYSPPEEHRSSRALESAMRERLRRLEAELLAERQARELRQASAQMDRDRQTLAYEQCVRDRRVDCDTAAGVGLAAPRHYFVSTPVYVADRPAEPLARFAQSLGMSVPAGSPSGAFRTVQPLPRPVTRGLSRQHR